MICISTSVEGLCPSYKLLIMQCFSQEHEVVLSPKKQIIISYLYFARDSEKQVKYGMNIHIGKSAYALKSVFR